MSQNIAAVAEEHNNQGKDFMEATKPIRVKYPDHKDNRGVSSCSHSFRGNEFVKETMHSSFLAISNGMNMRIVNAGCLPVYEGIVEEWSNRLFGSDTSQDKTSTEQDDLEPLAIRSIKRFFSLKKAWQSLISTPEDSEVEAEVLFGSLTNEREKGVVPCPHWRVTRGITNSPGSDCNSQTSRAGATLKHMPTTVVMSNCGCSSAGYISRVMARGVKTDTNGTNNIQLARQSTLVNYSELKEIGVRQESLKREKY